VPKLSNGTIFNDIECTLTHISRSRRYLTPNISETVTTDIIIIILRMKVIATL